MSRAVLHRKAILATRTCQRGSEAPQRNSRPSAQQRKCARACARIAALPGSREWRTGVATTSNQSEGQQRDVQAYDANIAGIRNGCYRSNRSITVVETELARPQQEPDVEHVRVQDGQPARNSLFTERRHASSPHAHRAPPSPHAYRRHLLELILHDCPVIPKIQNNLRPVGSRRAHTTGLRTSVRRRAIRS